MVEYLLHWSWPYFFCAPLEKEIEDKAVTLNSVYFLFLRVESQTLRATWFLECEQYKCLLSLKDPVRRKWKKEIGGNVKQAGRWFPLKPNGYFPSCTSLPCSDWLERFYLFSFVTFSPLKSLTFSIILFCLPGSRHAKILSLWSCFKLILSRIHGWIILYDSRACLLFFKTI